jgi:hypothetical protein
MTDNEAKYQASGGKNAFSTPRRSQYKEHLVDPSPHYPSKGLNRDYLTDESCSDDSATSPRHYLSQSTGSPTDDFAHNRFVSYHRISAKSNQSRNSKKSRPDGPVIDLISGSPQERRIPKHLEKRDSSSESLIEDKSPAKKVPLAPRNKNKVMFNFDKGFVAEKGKLAGSMPGNPTVTILMDDLTSKYFGS